MNAPAQDLPQAASAASTVESLAAEAVHIGGGAASGLLAGLVPYLLGAAGAAVLALGGWLAYERAVTIPRLQAQDALDKAALVSANAATAQCNASQDALRAQVEQQNARVAALQADAAAAAARAAQAGKAALAHSPPPPPADRSAASVNAWLRQLWSRP